jgi:protein-disulfide isomerase
MTDQKENNYVTVRVPKFNKTQMMLTVGLMIASFLIGSLWTKVQYLEKGGTVVNGATTANAQGAAQQAAVPQAVPTEDLSPQKVSIDDDPMMGDKNAPLTMIDFSDYECPFCKQYFDETFAQIKKDYIDTGKIKYIYRDLPLSFHDPMATLEAVAANCAREQGDDNTYFKYHNEIFNRTKSNGNGLAKDDLYAIAADLGLQTDTFNSCVDSEKYKDEVQKDLADATKVGASGTPTFFIGKTTTDGNIEGTKIVGAQPYSAFQAEIDKQLK